MKNGMFEGEPERDFFGNFSVPFKTVGKLISQIMLRSKRTIEQEVPN
jgi:hypothetical protein